MSMYKAIYFLLLAACIFLNAFIFINRDDYRYSKQIAYNELYPNLTIPALTAIQPKNDSTVIVSFFTDSLYTKLQRSEIALQVGIHSYSLHKSEDSLVIERLDKHYFKNHGNKAIAGIAVMNTPLFFNTEAANLNRFRDDELVINDTEKTNILNLLQDEIGISKADSVSSKVNKIGSYIIAKTRKNIGIPSDSLERKTWFQQFVSASDKAEIWCGHFAQFFNLFCYHAGIKTRYVEINKTYAHFPGNLHVFNEYFDTQTKQWVAIDLLNNILHYRNSKGKRLNAVQVLESNATDTTISVLQLNHSGQLENNPFATLPNGFKIKYNQSKDLRFINSIEYNEGDNLWEKIKRYNQKKYYSEIYSNHTIVDNGPYYFKKSTLMALFLLLALGIFAMISSKLKKH